MKTLRNHHFRNWAGNETCQPDSFFFPESEEEIKQIISTATSSNKKIRVVGTGHSWSSIACTNDYMISLDQYNKVIHIDKEKKRIRVQAGMKLKALNKILEENGMALINLGSISEQSIAGVTATGTHGTGIQYQIISSAIIGMRVIKANGDVLEIDENDSLLDAFRVSLGVLGIISEITLQCTDKFNLREEAVPMRFDDALNQLPQLLNNNDHVKFWWFPHVEHLMVHRYKRTQEPAQARSTFIKWVEDILLAGYFFAMLLRIGNVFPAIIPRINRFIKKLHLKKISRVGKSHELFNVAMPPRHRESEYAIPVDRAADALRELRAMIDAHRLKINFVVEARFVKGDHIWLSPAHGRDSCYIGGYLYGDKRWPAYFDLFEKLMQKYNGRPHWGKEFTPELHRFNSSYVRFDDFNVLRQQLDPDGRFQNALTAILGKS